MGVFQVSDLDGAAVRIDGPGLGDGRLSRAKRPSEASEDYGELVRQAVDLHSAGRLSDAEALYRSLLDHPQAQTATLHFVLGLLLAQAGRVQAALAEYDLAALHGYCSADFVERRADLLRVSGRFEEAISDYDKALAFRPDHAPTVHHRALALAALGRFAESLKDYDQAPMHQPNDVQILNNRGMALGGLAAHHEALRAFDQAVALRPAYAEALNNRSVALRWIGRFDDAIASATRASAVDPELASALVSRGAALARLNRYHDAIEEYEAALALTPESAPALLSRGLAREALGDLDGALADLAQAHQWAPSSPDPQICMGLVHIRQGAVEQGFNLYRWRWRKSTGPFLPHPETTLWTGAQPIADRTVLLYGEQGFGDVIQFCRFAADVAALGAHVLLQVQPALVRLVKTLSGPAEVLSLDQAAPPFDLHAPLMDLPAALGLSLQGLEGRPGYLSAPETLARTWLDRLGKRDRPRVGIAWTGNPLHENDHNRSMPFEALTPLFETKARFVSLQKSRQPDDAPPMDRRSALRCFGDEIADFADVAAVIHHCDAVVAVDTAVAHLAGAMGKPVFILLPHFADWRWMSGRAESLWYPSARLLRQASFGDWSAPVFMAAAAIDAL